jgi:hypothetical protein
MNWLRSFPADGVAVQIWYGGGLPYPPPLRDSAFPLSPSSFQRIRPYVGGTEPHPWYCGCSGDGISFNAAVWIGGRPAAPNSTPPGPWCGPCASRHCARARSIRHREHARPMDCSSTCSARLRATRWDRSRRSRPRRCRAAVRSWPTSGRGLPDPRPPRLLRYPPAVPATFQAVHRIHAGIRRQGLPVLLPRHGPALESHRPAHRRPHWNRTGLGPAARSGHRGPRRARPVQPVLGRCAAGRPQRQSVGMTSGHRTPPDSSGNSKPRQPASQVTRGTAGGMVTLTCLPVLCHAGGAGRRAARAHR